MARARQLIVTADDLGLHLGMNDGAIKAHRDGIVTACSLVANGRGFDHAVELLRENPRFEVGVHLTFVEEESLSGLSFPKNWRRFLARYPTLNLGALEREMRLQIERVLGTGLRVTHLNSHQHLHVLPRLAKMVRRLAQEFGIGYVRSPADHGAERRRLTMRVLAGFARRARLEGNERAIGIGDAGRLTAARLIDLVDHVDGVTELVTHPGLRDSEIAAAYDWGYHWDSETAALCDPAVRDAIVRHGITLARPSEVTT